MSWIAFRERTFRVIPVVLVFFAFLLLPIAARVAPSLEPVLYADHNAVYWIDSVNHTTTQTVPLSEEATALAVNSIDRSLWVLAHKHLFKFDAQTSLAFELDLESFDAQSAIGEMPDPEFLRINPYDQSIWIGAKKLLLHLDNQGALLSRWETDEKIEAISVGVNGRLWVLTKEQIISLSTQAQPVEVIDLRSLGERVKHPAHIAIDDLGGRLWIADGGNLVRFDTANLSEPPLVLEGGFGNISGLALNPVDGELWVVAEKTLTGYDRAGKRLQSVDLTPYKAGAFDKLSFEPVSRTLWVAGNKSILHFSSQGMYLGELRVDEELEAIAVLPFHLQPRLTLVSPHEGSLTNNATPVFRLGLEALCNDALCNVGDGYFTTWLIDAKVNGEPIGEFSIDENEAAYTPGNRLPEGLVNFTAQARDTFGHTSNLIDSRFTIDTIPPTIHVTSPPDGLLTRHANQTLAGHLSEPALLTLGGVPLAIGQGNSFAKSLNLQEGRNTFSLIAKDPAGNVSERALTVVLDTIPPIEPKVDSIAVSKVSAGQVTILAQSGAVEAGSRVTITNARTQEVVGAFADAMGAFSAAINASAGDSLSIAVLTPPATTAKPSS